METPLGHDNEGGDKVIGPCDLIFIREKNNPPEADVCKLPNIKPSHI